MATSYEVAIKEIEADVPGMGNEIVQLLNIWRRESAYGIRIVDNIKLDCKISVPIMKEFLKDLYDHRHLPIADLQQTIYEKKCHNYILRGPEIEKDRIGYNIGGAKPTEDFVRSLKSGSRTMTQSRALKLLEKLNSDKQPLTAAEEDITIANYSCWCTWSEDNPSDPFDFVTDPNRVTKIVANLGLSHRQSEMDHALFVYSKSAVDTVHFPTIADADVYTYFKCASESDYCGRTQPWNPPDYITRHLEDSDVKPRPEGVHKPVKLKDLSRPVKIIKYV